MAKNEINISDTITTIASAMNHDMISFESLRQKVEDEMKQNAIESKYGSKIQQLPSGLWWIRLDSGRVIKLTKRENVIKKLMELEKQNTEYTLESFWPTYFAHRKLSSSHGTVRIDKRYYENYILPTKLAKIPFSEISTEDIDAWVLQCMKINPSMKSKYFKNVVGTLSQMFQYAMKCKFITCNPAEDIEVHRDNFVPSTYHRDEDDFFLPNEEETVISLAYEDARKTKSALPLAIPFLFQTGIRDGELCALHWRDIEGQYLHVQSEIVEKVNDNAEFDGYKWVDHCKTKAGNRRIPLNSEARKILAEIKKSNLANGFPISNDDFIFLREYKKEITFCTTRCFETRIKKYCKQAKMEVLKSQHDIRRTFATNLYYTGFPIKNISLSMGHETIEQTEEYIKCRPIEDIFDYFEKLSVNNRNKIGTDYANLLENKKVENA